MGMAFPWEWKYEGKQVRKEKELIFLTFCVTQIQRIAKGYFSRVNVFSVQREIERLARDNIVNLDIVKSLKEIESVSRIEYDTKQKIIAEEAQEEYISKLKYLRSTQCCQGIKFKESAVESKMKSDSKRGARQKIDQEMRNINQRNVDLRKNKLKLLSRRVRKFRSLRVSFPSEDLKDPADLLCRKFSKSKFLSTKSFDNIAKVSQYPKPATGIIDINSKMPFTDPKTVFSKTSPFRDADSSKWMSRKNFTG